MSKIHWSDNCSYIPCTRWRKPHLLDALQTLALHEGLASLRVVRQNLRELVHYVLHNLVRRILQQLQLDCTS